MLHPSYKDLMQVVNKDVKEGETPIVNSRYSIVTATAKRARQLIDGAEPQTKAPCNKPFSIAVSELYEGKVNILTEEEFETAKVTRELEAAHEAEEIKIQRVQDRKETEAKEEKEAIEKAATDAQKAADKASRAAERAAEAEASRANEYTTKVESVELNDEFDDELDDELDDEELEDFTE